MEKDKNRRLSGLFPFFDALDKKSYETIMAGSGYSAAEAGDTLMEEGKICPGLSFVLSGSIRIYKLSETGREVTLYRIREGEICALAASCILGGMTFPIIAEAEQKTELFTIPRHIFMEVFGVSKALQRFIFQQNAKRLVNVFQVLENVAFERIDKRLAAYLYNNKNVIFNTHEKIAMELGTAREVVSRLLKNFEKEGLIRLSRGKISVQDAKKLRDIADAM